MSALSKRAAEVEAEFGAAWTRYHVGAQAARLVSGVLASVLWAVLHSGVSDWTALVPVATGALWATLAQMFPQVPWKLLKDRFTPPPKYATGGYIPGPAAAAETPVDQAQALAAARRVQAQIVTAAKAYQGPSSAPKTVGDVLSGGPSPTTTDPAPPTAKG